MKVCDRCGPKRAVRATNMIYVEIEGQEIDLCSDCFADVIEHATTVPKRKNKALFNTGKNQLKDEKGKEVH